MHRKNVSTQNKGVCNLKLAVPALVHLFAPMCSFMLFELRRPVKALLANFALVRIILGVHRDNVPL